MSVVWDICLFWVGPGYDGSPGGVPFRSNIPCVSGMVFVTLLCCQLLRHVLTMAVWMCFMPVSILASSMVLGFVSMPVLLYVACLLRLGVVCCAAMQSTGRVGCCDFCPICDTCSWSCFLTDRVCVSPCRWCVFVSAVHPGAILMSAVFCVIWLNRHIILPSCHSCISLTYRSRDIIILPK